MNKLITILLLLTFVACGKDNDDDMCVERIVSKSIVEGKYYIYLHGDKEPHKIGETHYNKYTVGDCLDNL